MSDASTELSRVACDVCRSPKGWRGLGICDACLSDWMRSPEQREGCKPKARPEDDRWREWKKRATQEHDAKEQAHG